MQTNFADTWYLIHNIFFMRHFISRSFFMIVNKGRDEQVVHLVANETWDTPTHNNHSATRTLNCKNLRAIATAHVALWFEVDKTHVSAVSPAPSKLDHSKAQITTYMAAAICTVTVNPWTNSFTRWFTVIDILTHG